MAAPTASISVRCCRRAMVTGLCMTTVAAQVEAIERRKQLANGKMLLRMLERLGSGRSEVISDHGGLT